MGKMKKILAAGVVCYVAYKLGKKYLKENNLTAEDVFDSAKKKAEEFARQAAGVVPTTKDGEPAGKKIYTFGREKRIEMVHLADGVTGLYDNKKKEYLDVIIRSLQSTLEQYRIGDILELKNASLRIRPEKIYCDLYRYLDGDTDTFNSYRGEYMNSYTWADNFGIVLSRHKQQKSSFQ